MLTSDTVLGGRVRYIQPRDGLRVTTDPVLLAASIPVRAGERVLEGGTGAGAALLCLAARVPGISGVGVDKDFSLIRLARTNAIENGWADLSFVVGDLTASPVGPAFDHAFANPPYHPVSGTPSPSASRDTAKRSSFGFLPCWVQALAHPLRHRGTLTLLLPPSFLADALQAMRDRGVPAECIFPVRSREGDPARLVIIQGRKNGRAPLVLTSGLTLHTEAGSYRSEVQAVLRDGAGLPMR
jgi:tRNA1(Val) A37 N6-methylase TrmN6